ncbi:MAG: TadE family protein [Alphaproteobacteria bacterium]|nr:TadE family protein [Alphaproteobacteria bacterium]
MNRSRREDGKNRGRHLTRLIACTRGVALIEFAIVFPFFFLMLFGGIEITRLILIQQKLEKAGYVLADIVTQYAPATAAGAAGEISVAEMNRNVFPQLSRIMNPYARAAQQAAIMTSVEKLNGRLFIRWQIAGGGSLSGCDGQNNCVRSIVNDRAPASINASVAGQTPSFPAAEAALIAGFVPTAVNSGNFVVSEVFYRYQPIVQSLLRGVGAAGGQGFGGFSFFVPSRIYVKRTYFIPRNGALLALPPTFPVP